MTTLYLNEAAYSVSWLVYINGIEVPAQSATVTYGVWQVPQANVVLVPDPTLFRLGAEDRISVTIFYCDQWYEGTPKFRLLFDGEIVFWGTMDTAQGRSLTFAAHDYVQILTQLFFFFMSSFDDMATGASGMAMGTHGATIDLAGYGALYPYSLFSQGLADTGDGAGNTAVISRPIDFAYNVVRALIKAQHPNRAVPATNFFAPWCKRTNFHKRWVALPYFDADPEQGSRSGVFPILRAVQDSQAVAAVSRMASDTGSSGSIWAMLVEVLQTLLMEISMLPTAAAVRSDWQTLLPRGAPNVSEGPTFLTNYFIKPQLYFSLPPVSNVFFPSQHDSYAYNENYATQATRMYFNEGGILSALNNAMSANGASESARTLMQDALCTGYPEEVDIAARDARFSPGQNGRNLLVYPEEFFKGPVIDRRTMPRWFSYLLNAMTPTPAAPTRDQPSPDSAGVHHADPGSQGTFHYENDAQGLNGADDAVYDPAVHSRFLSAFGLQAGALPHGALPSAEVMQKLRSFREGAVGRCVPPQCPPIAPASRCPRAPTTGPGSFFSSRGGSSGGRVPATHLHAGIDFAMPEGTPIVSVTKGTVSAKRLVGTNDGGNRIQITDELGGTHYYMHMSRFATISGREIAVGDSVEVGTTIGYVGGTGRTQHQYGNHLHYEAHDSTGKYALNYTSRINALRAGQTGQPAAAPTQPNAPVPAPAQLVQPGNTDAVQQAAAQNAGRVLNGSTSEISSADTTRNLFKLYAGCEYHTQRYSQRQGSMSGPFNPYPIPGFGCAVFGRRTAATDAFGYLSAITHNLTTASMTTQCSFTHGRTFQEMFALMERNIALESARLAQNRGAIAQAVATQTIPVPGATQVSSSPTPDGTDPAATAEAQRAAAQQEGANTLANYAMPVGATAMAPPEILEELRIMQDFTRANDFYKTLFFHGTGAGSDILTAEQFATTRGTADTVQNPFLTADEIAAARAGLANGQTLEELSTVTAANQELQARQTRGRAPVAPGALRDTAVFRYGDIIDMQTLSGTRIGVNVQGIDTTTRTRLLQAIQNIRNGGNTQRDLDILRNATGRDIAPLLGVQAENQSTGQSQVPVPPTAEQINELNTFLQQTELALRTESAQINVRGDVSIVPRQGAEPLFATYGAAMRYNSRPICTLDEYVDFLGEDGLREGPIHPGASNLYANQKQHPATYYTRIKRPRPGPPLARPSLNITNTATVSDAPAGAGASAPTGTETAPAIGTAVVNTSAESEAALARQNAAANPSGAAVTDASGSVAASTPGAGAGTYPVAGIPASFPDTRANWDVLLEQYRYNVLTRKAPIP